MISDGKVGWLRCMVLCGMLALCYASSAFAQRTTANLRGRVTDANGAPLPAAAITATNTQTGFKRTALANAEGVYILAGLQPGTYDVSIQAISYGTQTRRMTVMIGQDLNGDFRLSVQAIEVAGITATATRPIETRTSEVATNISRQDIATLPVPDRNILSLAALAPGMKQAAPNGDQYVQPSAGALPAANINVFIDGASLKSDVLPSGVAGQDASKGNPFPQSAVQEMRVITQNFKAEYQKASSAIITAVTRSGGNDWSASGFFYGQPESFIKPTDFQKAACASAVAAGRQCDPTANYKRYQAGASLGGPIIQNRANFFASWEGNYQDRTAIVSPSGAVPAGAVGLTQAQVNAVSGPFTAPFRENLFFGKFSYLASQNSTLELSGNLRRETDDRVFGGIGTGQDVSYESAEHFKDRTDMVTLRHQYTQGTWLNQAQLNYQNFQWKPEALDFSSPSRIYEGVITLGGRDTRQDFTQRRIELRNDVTYSGMASHVVKGGAYVGFMRYHVVKELTGNPIYRYTYNPTQGYNFDVPREVRVGFGNPDLSTNNTQVGVYLQDDWNLTKALQFNLGVRWDFETDMNNKDYRTPAAYITKFANILPASYFSTGNRKPFYGAIQPRFGFSYDVQEGGKTVVFGGAGIYYDRDVYNDFLDEKFRPQWLTYTLHFNNTGPTGNCGDCIKWQASYNTLAGLKALLQSANAPSPEQWFNDSNLKPPKSYQFTGGVRHAFNNIVASAAYMGNRGYNGVTYIWGHREVNPADPGAKPPTGNCCQWGTYGPTIVSDAHVRTWYDAVELQIQKPLLASNKVGGSLGVTFGRAEKNGAFGMTDLFSFDFTRVENSPRHASDRDQRYEVNGYLSWRAPFQVLVSTITQLGSGYPYVDTNCDVPAGQPCKTFGNTYRPPKKNFIIPNAFAYRRVDLRLQKDVALPQGGRVSVLGEASNVFNFTNFGCFNSFVPAGGVTPQSNPNYGKPSCAGPARRYQLGLSYGLGNQ